MTADTHRVYFVPTVPAPRQAAQKSARLSDKLRLMATFARNPLEVTNSEEYERPFLQFRLFGRMTTVLNDPELIRHFFVENAANLRHGEIRQALLRPALRDGLLTSDGEAWRLARKAMAPVFTPRNVDGFARSMRSTAEAFADTLEPGEALLAPQMSVLTYQVLSEALFSGEISADTEAMLADVALFLEALGHPDPLDLLQAPAWVPRPTKLRGRSSISRLRTRVGALIKSRATSMAAGEELPRDFASLLLEAKNGSEPAFSHAEIEDHLITFIGAGHETTARGLAWTLYLLANDGTARERIEAEIDGLDMDRTPENKWIGALPFTRACFEEAMRLYPPAAMIARVAIKEDHFNGLVVPARTRVMINLWVLHRHRMHWEEPERFDPERFLSPEREKIDRFAYLSFGLGPRVCIGASFAMQEAVILLAVLIRRFRFDYASDNPPWPVMRITVQPDNGMPMSISRR